MNLKANPTKAFYSVLILAVAILLYYSSKINYLIFHSFAEMASVGISLTIFIIVLNTSEVISNMYLKIVGLAYLFIAVLDILHTLAYEGMSIFEPGHFYANQLWIATRFFEAMVMLTGFYAIKHNSAVNIRKSFLLALYSGITAVIILSIFTWGIFPQCFIKGVGQTDFKIYSEYVISLIFTLNLFLLIRKKAYFPKKVYHYLKVSFIFYIATEMAFVQYVSNYGFMNLVGHYFKLIAFYFSYKALVETSIKEPYDMIFNELTMKTKQLEDLNNVKDRLFSIIGHDLKSPMASIKSALDYISLLTREETLDQIQHLLPSMKKSTLSAMDLLENLLQWSRTQNNTLTVHMDSFSIRELFKETSELFSSVTQQKNITLRFSIPDEPDLVGFADFLMITTVLRNLINNSIKFTHNGGIISVKAERAENHIIISVSDNGTGIKNEDLEKLFNFYTNISTYGTEGEKGTGLGLVLCKDFVEKNHGRIWVESTYGQGATFYFTVPNPI